MAAPEHTAGLDWRIMPLFYGTLQSQRAPRMLYTQKIKNETFLARKNGDHLAVGTVEVAQVSILSIYMCV